MRINVCLRIQMSTVSTVSLEIARRHMIVSSHTNVEMMVNVEETKLNALRLECVHMAILNALTIHAFKDSISLHHAISYKTVLEHCQMDL